jgi:hypothetical protein
MLRHWVQRAVEQANVALRRARARSAVRRMRRAAVAHGLDRMTMAEIDAEIAAARRERRIRNSTPTDRRIENPDS